MNESEIEQFRQSSEYKKYIRIVDNHLKQQAKQLEIEQIQTDIKKLQERLKELQQ